MLWNVFFGFDRVVGRGISKRLHNLLCVVLISYSSCNTIDYIFFDWHCRLSALCVLVRLDICRLDYSMVERNRQMGFLAWSLRVRRDRLWRCSRCDICQWWWRLFKRWKCETVCCCVARACDMRRWRVNVNLAFWLEPVVVDYGIYICLACKLALWVHAGQNLVCNTVGTFSHGHRLLRAKCGDRLLSVKGDLRWYFAWGVGWYHIVGLQEDRCLRVSFKDKDEWEMGCGLVYLRVENIRKWLHKCIPVLLMFGNLVL